MDPHQIRSHEIASPGGPGEAISCGASPEIDAPTPPGEAISRQGGSTKSLLRAPREKQFHGPPPDQLIRQSAVYWRTL